MLQQRLPLRTAHHSCRCLQSRLRRTYASEAQEAPRPANDAPQAESTTSMEIPRAPPPLQKKTVDIRRYTARTPGLRHLRRPIADHLWKGRPVHELTFPKKGHGKGGRNNTGRVTVRHLGGGHARRIRSIDFQRKAPGPHEVLRIEYDPNRTAHIALLKSERTGKVSYILAPEGMRTGEIVESYRSGIPDHLLESMGGSVDLGVLAARTAWRGNCLPLTMVPVGTLIFNIGLQKNKGGQMCRGAGTYGTLLAKAPDPPPRHLAPPEKRKKNKSGSESVKPRASGEKPSSNSNPTGTTGTSTSGTNGADEATVKNTSRDNVGDAAEHNAQRSTDSDAVDSGERNANSVEESTGSETKAAEALQRSEPPAAEEDGFEKTDNKDEQPMTKERWNRLNSMSKFVTIRLSSGEVRYVHKECCATIGVASNGDHRYAQLGKAGRSRWKNIRPTVRGVAMNAKEHPHGGGRGKSKGNVPSKSPWGIPTKGGYKTRKKRNINHAVVTPRPRKQGKRHRKGYN